MHADKAEFGASRIRDVCDQSDLFGQVKRRVREAAGLGYVCPKFKLYRTSPH